MSLRSSDVTPSNLWPVGCDPARCNLPGQGVGLPTDYLQGANRRVSPPFDSHCETKCRSLTFTAMARAAATVARAAAAGFMPARCNR